MALTHGYSETVSNESINKVKVAAENFFLAMNNKMQAEFIDGMADKWACNEAQMYFEKAKEIIVGVINGSNRTFDSVISSMNSAGSRWAQETQTGAFPTVSFSPSAPTLNISNILENIDGVRGIDLANAESTVTTALSNVENDAKAALNDAVSGVASSGFISETEQSNLTASLEQIRKNIGTAIEELRSSASSAIAQTVTRYGETSSAIANAFAGE